METFRLNSKLREKDREYLIQTSNDVSVSSVSTTVFVDGMRTDTHSFPHPEEIAPDELLEMVKKAHGDRKKELEGLLQAYQRVGGESAPDQMYQLANALFYKRLFHEALDLLNGVVALRSGHHQAHDLRGQTCLAAGQVSSAVEAGLLAVELRPNFADYRNHLGEAHLSAGSADQAIVEFEAAIGVNMYYGEAYFNLGLAHILAASNDTRRQSVLQSVSRAQEYMSKATLVYPEYLSHRNYQEGHRALENHDSGRALSLLGSVAEARRELRRRQFVTMNKRLLAHPDNWTVDGVGDQIRSLRSELDKHPNYLDMQVELAHCYMEQAGMVWDQGLETCQRIMEAHPNQERVSAILESALEIRASMLETIKSMAEES